jgi:hypothetical protein
MDTTTLLPFAFPLNEMGVEALICYAKSQAMAWKTFAESMMESTSPKTNPVKKIRKAKKTEKVEQVTQEQIEEPVEQVTQEQIEEPVEQVTQEQIEEPVEQVTQEQIEEPVEQVTEEQKKSMGEVYQWFDAHMERCGYAMKVFEKERVEGDIAKFLPEVEEFPEEERERFWNHVQKSVQKRQLEAHVVFLEDDVLQSITSDEIHEQVKGRFPNLSEEETVEIIVDHLQFVRDSRKEIWEKNKKAKPAKRGGKKKKEAEPEEDNTSETGTENSKGEKKKRGPTAYNLFIKEEIARLRAQDPSINHKVAMSMAVAAWKKNPLNGPKEEVTLENILSA